MPRGLVVKVHGQDAIGRVRRFRATVVSQLREAARNRGRQTVQQLRTEIQQTYTRSPSGLLTSGRGILFRTRQTPNEVSVAVYLPNVRHLAFLTSVTGGRAHLVPYPIIPSPPRRFLVFFQGGRLRSVFPGGDRRRRPIVGIEGGKLVFARRVWHPGFPRDVIADVLAQESALFQEEAQQIAKNAVVSIGQ